MSSKLSCVALPALLLVLLSAAACAGSDDLAEPDTATVEWIVDGDTLVLEGGSRVRLVQIGAPELGEGSVTRWLPRASLPLSCVEVRALCSRSIDDSTTWIAMVGCSAMSTPRTRT